jgi:hypothetical protein
VVAGDPGLRETPTERKSRSRKRPGLFLLSGRPIRGLVLAERLAQLLPVRTIAPGVPGPFVRFGHNCCCAGLSCGTGFDRSGQERRRGSPRRPLTHQGEPVLDGAGAGRPPPRGRQGLTGSSSESSFFLASSARSSAEDSRSLLACDRSSAAARRSPRPE